MAGGGSSEDNPVSLNVTAMVDIIFCLCLFFMCSFHFKQTQGRIESWLPQNAGPAPGPSDALLEEIRVVLRYEPASGGTVLRFGGRELGVLSKKDEREALLRTLGDLALEARGDHARLDRTKDVPVIIDAMPLVPWADVIAVMNTCKDRGLDRIEFAAPLPGR